MPIELFGFEIFSKKEREEAKNKSLLAITSKEDSAESIEANSLGAYNSGGIYGISVDMDGAVKEEINLITLYRNMAMYPECDYAIDDIINEAIVASDKEFPVDINLDNVKKIPEKIKTTISEEFSEILNLLDFNNQAYDIFRKWYVDGRLYYHVIIDKNNTQLGIQELRFIDPRKIKKIKVPEKKKAEDKNSIDKKYKEYFIYNSKGLTEKNQSKAIPIAKDSITFVHSGILDPSRKTVLSNLHKAIRPWNQLKLLEDAVVIYRISRAPERRIFYVDVGNLPKIKAEQYLQDLMTRFKNKIVYDASTGNIQDNRHHRTMLEDFWLPRREGGKGTEISTLPAGQNLGEIEDILFFRKKLYQALNVPRTRMEADSGFSIGRDTEITRDEVKFGKMIGRLRSRFAMLFLDLLKKQLILKNILTDEEWSEIKNLIQFSWNSDTHFIELQEIEIMKSRIEVLQQIEEFTGTYFSREWVKRKLLRQTDEEIKEVMKQIKSEEKAGILTTDPPGSMDQEGQGAPGQGGQKVEVPPAGQPGDSFPLNNEYSSNNEIVKTLNELINSVG